MEFLNPTIPNGPQFFSKASPFSPKYSLRISRSTNPLNPKITFSKFPLYPLFPLKFPKNFQVSAHFGRPTSRQNYLRKKLTQQRKKQQQVSQIPPITSPSSNPESFPVDKFDNDGSSGLQLSFDDTLENSGSENTIVGDNQNVADLKFWGTGTEPIFTVFINDYGKVERVDVDEDEIVERSSMNPLLFMVEEGQQHFEEVKSKIEHARVLAREMENGNNILANNDSSVTKVVKSSEQLGLVNMIMGPRLDKPGGFSRLSIVGGSILFGLFLVLGLKHFFTAKRGEEGYSRSEKEMLQRKIKARMEKEKLVKGTVEVVQDSKEPDIVFSEKPQLDKQDLLDALVKVKGENGSLGSQSLTDTWNSNSMDFAGKIEEIRAMARHAREIEKTDSLQGDIDDVEESPTGIDFSNVKKVVDIKPTSLDDVLANDIEMPKLNKKDLVNISDDSVLGRKSFGFDQMEKSGPMASNDLKMERTGSLVGDVGIEGNEQTVTDFSNEKTVIQKKSTFLDEPQADDTERPQLVNTDDNLSPKVSTDFPCNKSIVYDSEIKEIGAMAAQDMKRMGDLAGDIGDKENERTVTDFSNKKKMIHLESGSLDVPLVDDTEKQWLMSTDDDLTSEILSGTHGKDSIDFDCEIKEIRSTASYARESERTGSSAGDIGDDKDEQQTVNGFSNVKRVTQLKSTSLDDPQGDNVRTLDETPHARSNNPEESSVRSKPRIIKSAKEAREYLSQKRDKREQDQVREVRTVQEVDTCVDMQSKGGNGGEISQTLGINGSSKVTNIKHASGDNPLKTEKFLGDSKKDTTSTKNDKPVDGAKANGATNHESCDEIVRDIGSGKKENRIEKNFVEFEPIVKKIGAGFQENYMAALEKVNEGVDSISEKVQPKLDVDDLEFEWMNDDRLREIVFKVRENELMGRDPFHLMDSEDKRMFFEGLEKKVEKVNEKLVGLHQWMHSNVENLDYGADGISVHDPPEKMVPRWKGPPPDTTPVILDDYVDQRKALFAGNLNNSKLVMGKDQHSEQKYQESPYRDNTAVISGANAENQKIDGKDLKSSKTVIEGSDGSVKAGKKSGKEFWQHTKKWSRGFLECYNAETDPETKAVMKDIGKDLDRWITEKDIQEAADVMKKVPQKGQKVIREKLKKVRREVELYGPNAVVSKYGEYVEEKEVDYLWWLDLPSVACIELYMEDDGDKRIGFYSLEMGEDLELEPKPYHVIAFEDANDCKNLCYIIRIQMEMLGNGDAFVIPLKPKDAYLEAKASGFKVTVIRKGELKLNVDQTLEEVEEQITEIGSKMYLDIITRGRSVDMDSMMKGVFGIEKPTRRKRSKRRLRKPTK